MSESTTEAAEEKPAEAEGSEQKSDQSFTQADVDRIVADRLKRERDKTGDVKALKAAAEELAAIKESQKTEAQKVAERLAAAEKATKEAQREAVRFRVAAKFSISDEHADLYLHGDDEATLTRQAQELRKLLDESSKPRAPRPDPTQGRATDSTDVDAQARRILLGH